jgi:hypothetical protein
MNSLNCFSYLSVTLLTPQMETIQESMVIMILTNDEDT